MGMISSMSLLHLILTITSSSIRQVSSAGEQASKKTSSTTASTVLPIVAACIAVFLLVGCIAGAVYLNNQESHRIRFGSSGESGESGPKGAAQRSFRGSSVRPTSPYHEEKHDRIRKSFPEKSSRTRKPSIGGDTLSDRRGAEDDEKQANETDKDSPDTKPDSLFCTDPPLNGGTTEPGDREPDPPSVGSEPGSRKNSDLGDRDVKLDELGVTPASATTGDDASPTSNLDGEDEDSAGGSGTKETGSKKGRNRNRAPRKDSMEQKLAPPSVAVPGSPKFPEEEEEMPWHLRPPRSPDNPPPGGRVVLYNAEDEQEGGLDKDGKAKKPARQRRMSLEPLAIHPDLDQTRSGDNSPMTPRSPTTSSRMLAARVSREVHEQALAQAAQEAQQAKAQARSLDGKNATKSTKK